jgi:hypothetical protein
MSSDVLTAVMNISPSLVKLMIKQRQKSPKKYGNLRCDQREYLQYDFRNYKDTTHGEPVTRNCKWQWGDSPLSAKWYKANCQNTKLINKLHSPFRNFKFKKIFIERHHV